MKVSFISTRHTRNFFLVIRYFYHSYFFLLMPLIFPTPSTELFENRRITGTLGIFFSILWSLFCFILFYVILFSEWFSLGSARNIFVSRLGKYRCSKTIRKVRYVFVCRISTLHITVLLSIGQCNCFWKCACTGTRTYYSFWII